MARIISSLLEIDPIRIYLARIGAEPRSLKTAVVRENHGDYWKDISVIRFSKNGEVSTDSDEFKPTEEEEAAIRIAVKDIEWPELKKLPNLIGNIPEELKGVPKSDIYEFRDEDDKIIMLQVRIIKRGEKAYIPWTYWSDDKWRRCEPDGPLPLYNAEKLKNAGVVFIHEGAKAARNVQWMVDAGSREAKEALARHPWGDQLKTAVHLGWIGGALSPARTDWSILKRQGISRVFIVADNDEPGRAAVPAISQRIRLPTYMLQFTNEFPASFDLADEFPAEMFGSTTEGSFYIGPTFRDCLHPATWATDLVPNKQGKPTAVLRDSFKGQWAYIEEADLFVNKEMPETLRDQSILNKMMAPFSHVSNTAALILKAYQGRTTKLCFRPDKKGTVVTSRGSSAINLHMPTRVKPIKGDIQPFIDFLSYMFTNKNECYQVQRWCATLIARPDVRMGYALLLVSERQGIGKTTLGAHILAPLLGSWNVSFPSEADINSPFNEWVVNRRLAIVSEIYSGASWKSYHTLKSVITDKDVTVNIKYIRPFITDNWCHMMASSNSMRALKMENDDRRWFYPEVNEVPWPPQKFKQFREWIDNGGLNIIYWWAKHFKDYVATNERAPMTERKKELIEGSRSEAQREAVAVAEAGASLDKPAAFSMKNVVSWCRDHVQGRVFDTDYELRKAMVEAGLIALPRRIKIGSRMEYVLVNKALNEKLNGGKDMANIIRDHILKCEDLLEMEM